MKKVEVYKVKKDNEQVNALGEQGWSILMQSPVIIGIPFHMPSGASILQQFERWLNIRINSSAEERKILKKGGYKIKRLYSDEAGKRIYVFENLESSPLHDWRFEFDWGEEEPVAYITFGSQDMNIPAFAKKDVIDKYVPQEILQVALASGSLYVDEIEIEEAEENEPERN